MDVLLELEDVRAGYGSGPDILAGVSMRIGQGTTTCIIGPNGAGKSTTLKAVAGLLKPRAGAITLRGERLHGLRPDQVLARGVCFVPQDRSLFPDMSVKENLQMAGYLLGEGALLRERVAEALEAFPILDERRSQRARTLSGGQQQMLALARAWVMRPEVLLVDEPSMGLAPQVVREVFEVLGRFRGMGMTVILVEQNADDGLACADWGYVLDLGRNRFDGPADSVLAHPEIRELYLGKAASQGGAG